eukprot:2194570-Heterocapsa_arctica.AAC.1
MAPPMPPTPRTVLALCVGVQSSRISVRSRECQSEFDNVNQKSGMSINNRECYLELENVNQKSRMSFIIL